jgi:hypothetical protein
LLDRASAQDRLRSAQDRLARRGRLVIALLDEQPSLAPAGIGSRSGQREAAAQLLPVQPDDEMAQS